MTQAVLQVCLSKGWGGLEMYPIRLGTQLKIKNWQIFGLALEGSQVAEEMKSAGFVVTVVASKGEAIFQLFRLINLLKQNDISVIHCHKSSDLLIGALLKKFRSFRLIFTEHMGVTKSKKDLYHRWIYKQVDQLLAISDVTLARNRQALPIAIEKTRRLWLGTDVTPYPLKQEEKNKLLQEFGIHQDARIVGLIGRLCKGKGQRELIQAFAELNPVKNNYFLLLVGGLHENQGADPGESAYLQQLAKSLNITSHVIFSGLRKDINVMLSLMDIVCIPSYNEAFGLTVIEAMAAGKAIIGANTGAIPEVLGDAGLFISPKNISDITEKMNYMLTNKSKQDELQIKALKRHHLLFGIFKHIDEIVSAYLNGTNKNVL